MANIYDPQSGTYYKAEPTTQGGGSNPPVYDPNTNPNVINPITNQPAVEENKPWYMVRANQILIVAGVFLIYWLFIKKTDSPPVIGKIIS